MRNGIISQPILLDLGKGQHPPNNPKRPKGRCGKEFGLSIGAHERQLGGAGILSDTHGVDFGPYVERMKHKVSDNWHKLTPASHSMKKGKLAIEFAIKEDGQVAAMSLVASS